MFLNLRVPWTASRSSQSILREISPEKSLEGLMLKLKLQYLGHLMQRADSLEKTLKLEKIEGRREGDDRGWDGWVASPTQWTWVWARSGSWWWTGRPGVLQFMGWQRVRQDWAAELNWNDIQGCVSLKCTKWWPDFCIYWGMVTTRRLVNTSSTSHTRVCIWVWWELLRLTLPNQRASLAIHSYRRDGRTQFSLA